MTTLLYTGPSPHSGHDIGKFIRCPQLWGYGQIEPSPLPARTVSPALIKGSLGHVGLAHYYRRLQAHQRGEDPEQWWEPLRAIEERALTEDGLWLDFVPLAQQTVQRYLWEHSAQRIEVIGVEEVLQMDVVWRDKQWPHTRSCDLIVRAAGTERIVDHKFVGRLNDRTIDRYALSGQFLDLTLLGQQQWGASFGGVFLNLIEWPSVIGATPKMQQVLVPPAPHALGARMDQLRHAYTIRDRLVAADLDWWDYPKRLHEQVCNGPYGLCRAFELCRWGKAAAVDLGESSTAG